MADHGKNRRRSNHERNRQRRGKDKKAKWLKWRKETLEASRKFWNEQD